jgi:hypothetical protein
MEYSVSKRGLSPATSEFDPFSCPSATEGIPELVNNTNFRKMMISDGNDEIS